jgi:ABC-type amino acid transport substrate-binding protein
MLLRRRALTAALAVPALVVAACSSGPASSGTSGSSSANTTSSSAFKPAAPGVLNIATEIGNPGWVNGTGPQHLTGGVEYRMGLTFAKDFGLKPVFRNVSFTPLVAGAVTGYDIGLMTIFKTAAREKVNTYSDCYYTDPTAAFVRKGVTLTDAAQARKIRWGYVTGGYAGLIMNALKPTVAPKSFQDGPTEYQALLSGQVDAILDDLSSVAGRSQSGPFQGSGDHVAAVFTIRNSPPPCSAVQLPKNSPPQNVKAINAAIARMKSSGELRAWAGQYLSPLVNQHFPAIVVG